MSFRKKTMAGMLALFGAFALLVAFVPSASAQEYPPPGNVVVDTPPTPGGTINVSGNCTPGDTVDVAANGVSIGSTTCGADGTFALAVTVPADTPNGALLTVVAGGVQISASSIGSGGGGSGAGGGSGGGGLPNTGSNTIPMVQIALGLVAVGGLFLVISRKKGTQVA